MQIKEQSFNEMIKLIDPQEKSSSLLLTKIEEVISSKFKGIANDIANLLFTWEIKLIRESSRNKEEEVENICNIIDAYANEGGVILEEFSHLLNKRFNELLTTPQDNHTVTVEA